MSARIAILLLSLLAAVTASCAHRSSGSSGSASPDAAMTGVDLAAGKAVYARECAACHGEKGAGGQVGPSLARERSRKSFEAVQAIVLNPQPPMPKLYPSRLTKTEVRDVSAYVESL